MYFTAEKNNFFLSFIFVLFNFRRISFVVLIFILIYYDDLIRTFNFLQFKHVYCIIIYKKESLIFYFILFMVFNVSVQNKILIDNTVF